MSRRIETIGPNISNPNISYPRSSGTDRSNGIGGIGVDEELRFYGKGLSKEEIVAQIVGRANEGIRRSYQEEEWLRRPPELSIKNAVVVFRTVGYRSGQQAPRAVRPVESSAQETVRDEAGNLIPQTRMHQVIDLGMQGLISAVERVAPALENATEGIRKTARGTVVFMRASAKAWREGVQVAGEMIGDCINDPQLMERVGKSRTVQELITVIDPLAGTADKVRKKARELYSKARDRYPFLRKAEFTLALSLERIKDMGAQDLLASMAGIVPAGMSFASIAPPGHVLELSVEEIRQRQETLNTVIVAGGTATALLAKKKILRIAGLTAGVSGLLISCEADAVQPDEQARVTETVRLADLETDQARDACDVNNTGRTFEQGDEVFMCEDGSWVRQEVDSGILVFADQEGIEQVYERLDEIPGGRGSDFTYNFSHWASEAVWDEELGAWVRTACYATSEGLGCDVRYKLVASEDTNPDDDIDEGNNYQAEVVIAEQRLRVLEVPYAGEVTNFEAGERLSGEEVEGFVEQSEAILNFLEGNWNERDRQAYESISWQVGVTAGGEIVLSAECRDKQGRVISLIYPDGEGGYEEVRSVNPEGYRIRMYFRDGDVFAENDGSVYRHFSGQSGESGWAGVQDEPYTAESVEMPDGPFFYYTVGPGDTLIGISQRYGVSLEAVESAMVKAMGHSRAEEIEAGALLLIEAEPNRGPYVGLQVPAVGGGLGDLRQIETVWQITDPDAIGGEWVWSEEIRYRPYAVPLYPNAVFIHRGSSYEAEQLELLQEGNEVIFYRGFSNPALAEDKSLIANEGFFTDPLRLEVKRIVIIDAMYQSRRIKQWSDEGYKMIVTCHPADYQGEDPPERMVFLLKEKLSE